MDNTIYSPDICKIPVDVELWNADNEADLTPCVLFHFLKESDSGSTSFPGFDFTVAEQANCLRAPSNMEQWGQSVRSIEHCQVSSEIVPWRGSQDYRRRLRHKLDSLYIGWLTSCGFNCNASHSCSILYSASQIKQNARNKRSWSSRKSSVSKLVGFWVGLVILKFWIKRISGETQNYLSCTAALLAWYCYRSGQGPTTSHWNFWRRRAALPNIELLPYSSEFPNFFLVSKQLSQSNECCVCYFFRFCMVVCRRGFPVINEIFACSRNMSLSIRHWNVYSGSWRSALFLGWRAFFQG